VPGHEPELGKYRSLKLLQASFAPASAGTPAEQVRDTPKSRNIRGILAVPRHSQSESRPKNGDFDTPRDVLYTNDSRLFRQARFALGGHPV
jgi:hypothetical protein